jgi:phosphomevalonate kinase
MKEHTVSPCCVSAPGKALIAGGYLILEPGNVGVTISTTARFYSSIRLLLENGPPSLSHDLLKIVLDSPQFHSQFLFSYSVSQMCFLNGASSNDFVAKCLEISFSFLRIHFGHANFESKLKQICGSGGLAVKLRADNDFYSQISEVLLYSNYELCDSSL